MLSIKWVFIGAIVGFLLTSVFTPPARPELEVPSPHNNHTLSTGNGGCVRFKAEDVPCDGTEVSLNLLASQNK
jgi:hypothetical protein